MLLPRELTPFSFAFVLRPVTLYNDIINIFIYLLKVMGDAKSGRNEAVGA
jgi:hypothetical protein